MDHTKGGNGQQVNPRKTASFISAIVFWWVNPIMKIGSSRNLQVNNLYAMAEEDTSETLSLKLQREWEKELALRSSKNDVNDVTEKKFKKQEPSLARALFRTFGFRFALVGLYACIGECFCRIAQSLCLSHLVYYCAFSHVVQSPDGQSMVELHAYLYATGIVLGAVVATLLVHTYCFESDFLGMQMRVATCSLAYNKCLKLSPKSLGETGVGQITNLISNDVSRFDPFVFFFHYLWIASLQTLLTAAILYHYIGPSCLVGLAFLVIYVPLQSLMGRFFARLRMKTAGRTDERIRTINEIIAGMRVIKMYSWESISTSLIELCRSKEVQVIRKRVYLHALNLTLFFCSSKIMVFLTILIFVLSGNSLAAEQVFLTVALFNNVRIVLGYFFPASIAMTADTLVSIKRIQNFLLSDELTPESKSEIIDKVTANSVSSCFIEVKNVNAKWQSKDTSEGNTLSKMSFHLRAGELLVVIGEVGCGKSSLLNLILGELPILSGTRRVVGRLAYASQEPWIFSGTVRQNILCGLDLDVQRYGRVVKAVALDKDFSRFPLGDLTVVGERGVSLSGGQKARINLARCLYVDADIYLLDDPLSAVDAHVGRHLFYEAIQSYLGNKIRILVTHQLQYLKDADKILVLSKEGCAKGFGTYTELRIICKDAVDSVNSSLPKGDAETAGNCSDSIPKGDPSPTSRTSKHLEQHVEELSNEASTQGSQSQLESSETTTGTLSVSTYWHYFRAAGSWFWASLLIANFVFTQMLFSASEYWLMYWTDVEEHRSRNLSLTVRFEGVQQPFNYTAHSYYVTESSVSRTALLDTSFYAYVFTGLTLAVFIFSFALVNQFFITCLRSSVNLHSRMLNAIMRAPLQFFDRNPIGRILNRFAKDIGSMDDSIALCFFDVISITLVFIAITILVAVVTPWLLLPIAILTVMFLMLWHYYVITARQIKVLETTTRSPVYTHLSSSLIGLTTLRAHHRQSVFQRLFDRLQDVHSSAWHMLKATSCWFGFKVDAICAVYIACVAYVCVVFRHEISASEAGMAISCAMTLTGMINWGMRQLTEMDSHMLSVERVMEYGRIPPEAELQSKAENVPPKVWPTEGSIRFENVSLRYQKEGKPVLKNITCFIHAQEKVGIVGRTGAGKSSLITCLFRLAEPEGKIVIDGIDCCALGLRDLRSKIAIIPQDPILFTGTLRYNLDPSNEYEDHLLWSALEAVALKESFGTGTAVSGLEFAVAESGTNLSVGQRQLICLARALLRQNRILVMDEATANIDSKTDTLIQVTIREKFQHCTVLTIAHRLNTIMDSDRIMVMDAGCLVEFEEPVKMLKDPTSLCYQLVQQTGIEEAAQLTALASQAAESKLQE